MTILHIAGIRGLNPEVILEKAIDFLCRDPQADIMPLLGF